MSEIKEALKDVGINCKGCIFDGCDDCITMQDGKKAIIEIIKKKIKKYAQISLTDVNSEKVLVDVKDISRMIKELEHEQ